MATNMNEKDQLLRKVQEIEFALVDLGQYLDSHPDCAKALTLHKQLKAEHDRLVGEYEQQFGPLTAGGSGNTDYWDWVATPFPWENC